MFRIFICSDGVGRSDISVKYVNIEWLTFLALTMEFSNFSIDCRALVSLSFTFPVSFLSLKYLTTDSNSPCMDKVAVI